MSRSWKAPSLTKCLQMERLWIECSWMERWLAARWGMARSQATRSYPRGRRLLRRLQVAELDAKAQRVRATRLTCGAKQVELCADELQTVLVDGALTGGTLGEGALAGGALVPTRTTADVAPADCGAGREGTVCPCYWTNFWRQSGGATHRQAAGGVCGWSTGWRHAGGRRPRQQTGSSMMRFLELRKAFFLDRVLNDQHQTRFVLTIRDTCPTRRNVCSPV